MLTPVSNNNTRFAGGTFDGRYVYFAPIPPLAYITDPSVFLRHDTQVTSSSFDQGWEALDAGTLGVNDTNFEGAVFDGRYVYYVPSLEGRQTAATRVPSGRVVRYDTHASFTATASWQQHTIAPTGFVGGVFDGRYIYFSPWYGSTVARFDTQGDFADAAAWTQFDLSGLDATATRFSGGVFDGHYVYFVPYGDLDVATSRVPGVVARYDTTASFTSQGAWSKFALTSIDARAMGYKGAVFDGRYVHFVPYFTGGTSLYRAIAIRYDTQATFTALPSWTSFDIASVDAHAMAFYYGGFDGRYVYFSPFNSYGDIARFDTQRAYSDRSAWSTFELNAAGFYAGGSIGAVFTGRYLYLIPYIPQGPGAARRAIRFDAKTPPALPTLPAHFGSFFFDPGERELQLPAPRAYWSRWVPVTAGCSVALREVGTGAQPRARTRSGRAPEGVRRRTPGRTSCTTARPDSRRWCCSTCCSSGGSRRPAG